jgi:Flp pilus assembly pilin Flp
MKIKSFLQEERGAVVVEYVILVAAAGILLGAGVIILMNAMSGYFSNWAAYFGAGS